MLASLETALSVIPKSFRFYSSSALKTRRSGVRRIAPVKVENETRRNPRPNSSSNNADDNPPMSEIEFRKQFRQEIMQYGDVYEEPNMSTFGLTHAAHMKESEDLKRRIKNQTMVRKHFRDIKPRKMNLLTYAEKENIRYLAETEPEEWTPEALAKAYPIDADGVVHLIKDKRRCKRVKDVMEHDSQVVRNLQNIKSGKFEVSPELEERLKIRNMIPLRIGDLGVNGDKIIIDSEPKVLGEFARLVAPSKIESSKQDLKKNVKNVYDGDYCDPSNSYELEVQSKPELSKSELKKILPTRKPMTFNEFESRMKQTEPKSLPVDMKYMLDLNKRADNSAVATHASIAEESLESESASFPSKIQRLKTPEDTGKVEVSVEHGEMYVYQPETGYQKPYETKIQQRIRIPDDAWKPGATYKVGNCYYDDEGEFLYRVV